MEENQLHNLKLNYNISIISWYVDDILMIYNNNKYIEEQIEQEHNAIHNSIEFTFEMGGEKNNSLNYLAQVRWEWRVAKAPQWGTS
jgi:hypothetical protein